MSCSWQASLVAVCRAWALEHMGSVALWHVESQFPTRDNTQVSCTLATWCGELTHLKRPWCWEGLGAGGKGDDRGWDGWMASPTQWTWVWVNSGSWWWTGRPGVLQSMGSQRVEHNWATEMNWTELIAFLFKKTYRTALFCWFLLLFLISKWWRALRLSPQTVFFSLDTQVQMISPSAYVLYNGSLSATPKVVYSGPTFPLDSRSTCLTAYMTFSPGYPKLPLNRTLDSTPHLLSPSR